MTVDYGRDISCTDDCDAMFSERDGDDILLLCESLYRRLITPRGRLIDDPLYGYDVRAWWNKALDKTAMASLAASVRAECIKDERVSSAKVTLDVTHEGGAAYAVAINIVGTSSLGPFKFTLGVDGVTVALLKDGVT